MTTIRNSMKIRRRGFGQAGTGAEITINTSKNTVNVIWGDPPQIEDDSKLIEGESNEAS